MTNFNRINKCPGSYKLEKTVRTKRKGEDVATLAKNIAANYLIESSISKREELLSYLEDHEGALDAVNLYVDYVLNIASHDNEETLDPKYVDRVSISTDIFGNIVKTHLDAMYISEGKVHIFKFNYSHTPICLKDDLNITASVSNALHGFSFAQSCKFIIHCIQPNIFTSEKISTLEMYTEEFNGLMDKMLRIFSKANERSPELKTSEMCRNCSAIGVCPEIYKDLNQASLKVKNQSKSKTLEYYKKTSSLFKYAIAGLEEEMIHDIKCGIDHDGFTVGNVQGRRLWNVSHDELKEIGDSHGIDLFLTSPISPSKAEKAGLNKEVVKMITESIKGEEKLIRKQHRRD
jgi:hypothetical protein